MDPDPSRSCRTAAACAQVPAIAVCVFTGQRRDDAHLLFSLALKAGVVTATD